MEKLLSHLKIVLYWPMIKERWKVLITFHLFGHNSVTISRRDFNARNWFITRGLSKNKTIYAFVYELFTILNDYLESNGGDLSWEKQQQLAIALVLLGNPKLRILYEPKEGLKPNIILDIEQSLNKIINKIEIRVLLLQKYLQFVRQWVFTMSCKAVIVPLGEKEDYSEMLLINFLAFKKLINVKGKL